MKSYGFPESFIHLIRCLYVKSSVCINVNGILTEPFNVERGVKQGCPLSAALYVLAISPLIKTINSERLISGTRVGLAPKITAMAYADDVTVVIKNQMEMDVLTNHLNLYELASGAKLNHDKTEGVWIGVESNKRDLNIKVKDEIKILGLTICNQNCSEKKMGNWENKLCEVKEVKKMGK